MCLVPRFILQMHRFLQLSPVLCDTWGGQGSLLSQVPWVFNYQRSFLAGYNTQGTLQTAE